MNRFENKTVLVTGSSQGIGAACAIRFAQEGANVIFNGHKFDERGEKLISEVEQMGRKAVFIEADISRKKGVEKLIAQAVKAFGGLDVLVNNAGMEIKNPFWKITEEEYDDVMNTNFKGLFFGIQAFTNYCIKQKIAGVIVNVSSVHEEIPFPGYAAYCASKGAVKMLCRNLAIELADFNIRINNVAPGAIETPINKSLLANKKKLNKVLENIPLKRLGKPEDVAGIVSFLASSDADYVTGSSYFVDGGLTWQYEE